LIATINFFKALFEYDFMQHAFIAGSLAALVAGIVGYFVVIRNLAFAGHALGHIGFAGAAGAGLVGLTPPMGQLILTSLAAMGMGAFDKRLDKSDMIIGIILAFSLGLGVLFLYFYKAYAGQAMSILFGDLLGVSQNLIYWMLFFSSLILATLFFIARPLLFASLEPELAQAKGISLNVISILFLLIVAVAVTEASQIVGVLLVFTLLIGPPASALNWARNFWGGMLLTAIISLGIVWAGIILTYVTDWPASFWISFLSLAIYLGSKCRLG
jgi:zinc/manganese transport system permease protein